MLPYKIFYQHIILKNKIYKNKTYVIKKRDFYRIIANKRNL